MAIPAVEPDAGQRRQEHRRHLPGERHQPEQELGIGEPVDQPRGGQPRHPRADERDGLADEEQAEVAGAERAERRTHQRRVVILTRAGGMARARISSGRPGKRAMGRHDELAHFDGVPGGRSECHCAGAGAAATAGGGPLRERPAHHRHRHAADRARIVRGAERRHPRHRPGRPRRRAQRHAAHRPGRQDGDAGAGQRPRAHRLRGLRDLAGEATTRRPTSSITCSAAPSTAPRRRPRWAPVRSSRCARCRPISWPGSCRRGGAAAVPARLRAAQRRPRRGAAGGDQRAEGGQRGDHAGRGAGGRAAAGRAARPPREGVVRRPPRLVSQADAPRPTSPSSTKRTSSR